MAISLKAEPVSSRFNVRFPPIPDIALSVRFRPIADIQSCGHKLKRAQAWAKSTAQK
jgi:hypothetical protein